MNKKLEPQKLNIGPLTRFTNGYYSEIIIQNNTTSTIVVIDHNNNKIPILPVSMTPIGSESVNIYSRSSTTPTVTENNIPKEIPGFHINIPKHILFNEQAIFIKEINCVICTESAVMNASHPNSATSYEAASFEIREILLEQYDKVPTIKIAANDPDERYHRLFTVLGKNVVPIEVSNISGDASLTVSYFWDDHHDEYVVDLEEFLNSGENILEVKDCPITFIATNPSIAKRCMDDYKKISQVELDNALKKREERYAKEKQVLKNDYDTQLKAKDTALKAKQDELDVLNSKWNQLKTNYDTLIGALDSDQKSSEYDYKKTKSKNDKETEKWKAIGTYGALILGGIGLVLKAIDMYNKAKKE